VVHEEGHADLGRASAALEAFEALLAELGSEEARADSDWVVVAGPPAAVGHVSDDERQKFAEAEQSLAMLQPLAEKMRRKCQAHARRDVLEERLREQLGMAEEEDVRSEKVLKVAQGAVSSGEVVLQPLLEEIMELTSVATYGSKTRERVMALLARLEAAENRFRAELVPRLAPAVVAREVEDAARVAEAEQQAALQAEDEQREAKAKALRPVEELMALSEEKLQVREVDQSVARDWQCVQSTSLSDFSVREWLPFRAKTLYS